MTAGSYAAGHQPWFDLANPDKRTPSWRGDLLASRCASNGAERRNPGRAVTKKNVRSS